MIPSSIADQCNGPMLGPIDDDAKSPHGRQGGPWFLDNWAQWYPLAINVEVVKFYEA